VLLKKNTTYLSFSLVLLARLVFAVAVSAYQQSRRERNQGCFFADHSSEGMKRLILTLILGFSCQLMWAQTLVQHVSCPNSRNTGNSQRSTPDYYCPLPEPAQSGNSIIVGVVAGTGATFSLSDDKSNPYTLINSVTDSGNNIYVAVYRASNVTAGTRLIDLHRTSATGETAMSLSEYYNVGAVDASSCHINSSSTTITAGSITPAVSGDLLWQFSTNGAGGGGLPNSVSSFTKGSQPNITWQLLGTDIYDGDATQAGVYSSTSAINPTLTSGTAEPFDSCVVALKATSSGNAPKSPFRILHMLHQQMPNSAANPFPIQFPTSGNLVVASYISGGSLISSATSSPSNTWSSTGTAAGGLGITAASQIYYAANASTSNAMTISFRRDSNTSDATYMMYDITGAATSPFDSDSGGQTGNQTSEVRSFTTCSGCLTPSAANELIVANQGQNWCTSTASTAPSGSLFDAATDTGNSVNGPQSVDQNNGWLHYYDPNTSAITATWTNACSQAEGTWAGRVAAFKAASSTRPAPPTGLTAVPR
jgi:hypothetical protein